MQWNFPDPFNKPVYIPCKPSQATVPWPCIELTPPLKASFDVVACLKDFICRNSFKPPPPESPVTGYQSVTTSKEHTCALAKSGALFCWGQNDAGQLGHFSNMPTAVHQAVSPAPIPEEANVGFVSLSAGDDHTCAISKAGYVFCWGGNIVKELANTPTIYTTDAPVSMAQWHPLLQGPVDRVTAGRRHSCAHLTGGSTVRWGEVGRSTSRCSDWSQ